MGAAGGAGTVVLPVIGTVSGSAAAFLLGLPGLIAMCWELWHLIGDENDAKKARDEAKAARIEAESALSAARTEKARAGHEKNVAWSQYLACLNGVKI